MLQPSIPQGELYLLLKITWRHPLCVNNVLQIYCWVWGFFWVFLFVFFLSRVICIYLTALTAVTYLIKWIVITSRVLKKILCLLKETNSSSNFSMVLIYCICSKFCLKGTMFNAQKHLQPFILSWRMHWFQKLCYSHPLCNPYDKMFSL